MNKQSRFTAASPAPAECGNGVAAISSPGSLSRQPYTYEHVSLDDYTETYCLDCEGVGEVEILALDAVRPVIVDCDECDGTGKVKPRCQCGEPVTGGSADGDNSVCHSCELVFHRDGPDQLEGWGLAEASWAMPTARSGAVPAEPVPVSGLRPPAAIAGRGK